VYLWSNQTPHGRRPTLRRCATTRAPSSCTPLGHRLLCPPFLNRLSERVRVRSLDDALVTTQCRHSRRHRSRLGPVGRHVD
jgi:hypothetical protein